jgi:threonylcarbamoyladenosine tRNA methylthiotransferase MtaB
MPDQVPVHVARERNRVLRELAAEKNLAFRQKFIGQSLDVITLQASNENCTEALSDNYLKITIPGCHQPNQWKTVQIERIVAENLIAKIIEAGLVSVAI